ncbi:hypothetical protein [Lachnobacterium bovis]|uniref:hypothetical protein n=1 Tax=Lachnobacterium bovis TaxID=140626 RepID=UPI0003B6AF89|nr:hypothetical protein [Lachnobacterium bovis]
MKRVQCPNCGAIVEYDDKSVWEGNRDFEEVNCPNCDEYLTRVFTDGFPNPHIIKK